MAADVTACSLPDTPDNWEIANRLAGVTYGEDDDVVRDDDGEPIAVVHGDDWEPLMRRARSDPAFRWFEIGPISYMKASLDGSDYWLPGPTWAAHIALARPRVMTLALRGDVMAVMNVPDHSHYRHWHRPTSGNGLGRHHGRRDMPRRQRRKAQPRQVKAWLGAQESRIVWAETW